MIKKILLFCIFIIFLLPIKAQKFEDIFRSLSVKDRIWVARNYSSVIEAKRISLEVIATMDSLNIKNFLGGNSEGGLFDAFRHIYWMYCLANELGSSRAERLGEIYENYDKWLFDVKKQKDYDQAGMDMDLFNNHLGILLSDSLIADSLVFNEIQNILNSGKAKVIKKNQNAESLDINGYIIPDSLWKNQWYNDRVLINSDELDFYKSYPISNMNTLQENYKK